MAEKFLIGGLIKKAGKQILESAQKSAQKSAQERLVKSRKMAKGGNATKEFRYTIGGL